MSNILATNPRLEDLIRKQVNEYGLNHGRISDNQGMIMDSNGNTTNYRGSNGRHPNAKINKNSLYEGGGQKTELNEEPACWLGKCRWDRIKDKVNDAIDNLPWNNDTLTGDGFDEMLHSRRETREATSSGGASGSYVAPLDFDETDETEEIMERVMRDEVSKLMLESQELNEMPTCYSWCYGHGGTCGGKYGPCNIPDTGSFDRVADIPKGGQVTGGGCNPTCPKYETCDNGTCVDMGMGMSDGEMKSKIKESLKNRITNRILNEIFIHDCEVDPTGMACDECCNSGAGDAEGPDGCCAAAEAMGVSYGGHDKDIRHGMGSGFKEPQGGSDRLEKFNRRQFNRRQMNEADVPGISITKKTLKKAKSENNAYLKSVDKKMKEYLNFNGNSHPEFPHQNNSKTDYKSPMYRNNQEDEDFIDDFRGMGLQNANGVETLDRIDDYLNGSTKTGNSQDAANVIPSTLGSRLKKNMKRKKEKIAKQKSKMTNLRGVTPDVQTVTNIKESKDISRMKKLISHKVTGQ